MRDDEVIENIKDLTIDCPVCPPYGEDDQYTCTVCWGQGGYGRIGVLDYIKEHPEVFGLKLIDKR